MIDFDKRPPRYRGTIEIYRGADGDWYWRAKSTNGRKIKDGSEGYSRRDKCIRAADRANEVDMWGFGRSDLQAKSAVVVPWRVVIYDRNGDTTIGALY